MVDRPLIHPDRKRRGIRPMTALTRMRQLVADPENTRLVFDIVDALNGDSVRRDLKRFCRSEQGERHLAERVELPTQMDDHRRWLELPDGTVGRAYVDFMRQEGLSAQGLVEESLKHDRPRYDDDYEWYGNRLRDTHDLYHVLTGYGRDALGEQCVLLFTHGQSPSQGHLLIGYAGSLNIKLQAKGSKAPIMGAVNQAKRTGKGAKVLMEQPIRELLKQPLDEVRAALNIPEPTRYRECHRVWREEGIDPYDLLASENTPEKALAA